MSGLDDMPTRRPPPDRHCPACGAVPGEPCVDYRVEGSHVARIATDSAERIVPAGPFGMTPNQAADDLHDAHVELLMLRRDKAELREALKEAIGITGDVDWHRSQPEQMADRLDELLKLAMP